MKIDFDSMPIRTIISLFKHNKEVIKKIKLHDLSNNEILQLACIDNTLINLVDKELLTNSQIINLLLNQPSVIEHLPLHKINFDSIHISDIVSILKIAPNILGELLKIGDINYNRIGADDWIDILYTQPHLISYVDLSKLDDYDIERLMCKHKIIFDYFDIKTMSSGTIKTLSYHYDILGLCSEEQINGIEMDSIVGLILHNENNKKYFNVHDIVDSWDINRLITKYPHFLREYNIDINELMSCNVKYTCLDKLSFIRLLVVNPSLLELLDLYDFIKLYAYYLVKFDTHNILTHNDNITIDDIKLFLSKIDLEGIK